MEDTKNKNKELVKQIDEAFSTGDISFVLSHMTNDILWNMIGDSIFTGKKEVERMLEKMAELPPPELIQKSLTAEGNRVVAEGSIKAITKEGKKFEGAYCDSYVLEDGKILQLNSYVVEVKGDQV